MKKRLFHEGHTLVELVVYIALLAIVSVATVNGLSTLARSFLAVRLDGSVSVSANDTLERIVRELRSATTVDDLGSIYSTSPGKLLLATASSTGTTTVEFALSGGTIRIKENGGSAVAVSSPLLVVDSLIFRKAATSTSVVVGVELGVHDTRSATTSPEMYRTAAVLRGTY